MNWAEIILAIYAVGGLIVLSLLVFADFMRLRRIALCNAADALFCAAIWPVIAGVVVLNGFALPDDQP